MTFFARPNLDDTQFKQLPDSVLSLSGLTQVQNVTGLTLYDNVNDVQIPIIVSGATNEYVLTYDNITSNIRLKPSASAGAFNYSGASPTTCTVGGLSASTAIFNCPIQDILQSILVPTLNPTLTNPSISSFSLSPSTSLYEVGAVTNICGTTIFNTGCINPLYGAACDKRSCGAICYIYNAFGVCVTCNVSVPYSFGSNSWTTAGNKTFSACVCYCDGVQPYKSDCVTPYCSPLSTGVTSASCVVIATTYPWYWGIESSGGAASGVNRPSTCCIKDVITGGTGNKVVGTSTGTLNVTFGSTTDDYLWFATPVASCTKTCWYVDALNNNPIGGAVNPGGNLFPAPETVTGVKSVGTGSWSGQSYKIYISNYQSAATLNMALRNS